MRKYQIALIFVVAFLAGGTVANIDIVAQAANGNSDAAMKSLVARVTGLEERVTALEDRGSDLPVTIKYKVYEDEECAPVDPPVTHPDIFITETGWCPDGARTQFAIEEADVSAESMLLARALLVVNAPGNVKEIELCTTEALVDFDDDDRSFVFIACSSRVLDDTDLRLLIIDPSEP